MYPASEVLSLAGTAGTLLLKNGAEIFRVQETISRILQAYQVENYHAYVVSNGIFVTVNESGVNHQTLIRYIPLDEVNLSRICAVNQVSRAICAGQYTPQQAAAELQSIATLRVTPMAVQILACGVASAAFCCLFGGTLLDGAYTLLLGILLKLFQCRVCRFQSKFTALIAASALVTLLSGAGTLLLPALHRHNIVTGGIITLLPGVPFTTSIREFFNSDYLSGIIHMVDALLTAICIALGVYGAFLLLEWLGVPA